MTGKDESGVIGPARWLHAAENVFLSVMLLLMAVIPVAELVGRRWFGGGIVGASDYLRHLTLWVAFIGAAAATRDDRHLKMVASIEWAPGALRRPMTVLSTLAAAVVTFALLVASVELIVSEAPALPLSPEILPVFLTGWLEPYGLFDQGSINTIGRWLPVWIAESVMAFGFAVMGVRFVFNSGLGRIFKVVLLLAAPAAVVLLGRVEVFPLFLTLAGFAFLAAAALSGTPIFVILGGAALLLFKTSGVTIASIPAETYRIVASPILPTIPIFTLVGFILSEGRSSERLVKLFDSFCGWIPGGTAVAATLLCAFFTTFTGASGVTILALGGLLLPVLVSSGFSEKFSLGLLTSTGSIGLLLPPSLVVILYGVIAHVSIKDMFKAAILPGHLLILPVIILCLWQGRKAGATCPSFRGGDALKALWGAKWELAMPILALVLIFGGFCTLVQAAAIMVLYSLLVVFVILRDLPPSKFFPVLTRCAVLVGAVLIVLGVAMGLTSFLVDAQVPTAAASWAEENLQSRWLFLLALNGGLILVGCMMDIYSALVVVVPLILPMSVRFGVDPAHLGIIFLANLQLGYLTPPVGMNLFLASMTFDRPLVRIARYVLPFLLIMAVVVLLITYVPWLTVGVLKLLS